jgi:hypothetical protein
VLEDQSREVTVLTKVEQVLEVERVDAVLRVVVDDLVRDEERLARVGGAQTVHRETTGQTGDGAEQRLERLGEVVRD